MPYGLKDLGQQITMQEGQKPRIGQGKKVYNSVQEALKNNGDRYRGPNGKVRQLYMKKVPGVQDTWELKSKLQQGANPFSGKGNRKDASRLSTAQEIQESPEQRTRIKSKIGEINRKGKQYHHLVSLRYYQPYFEALDEAGRAELTRLLNEKNIYPGDDPKNYAAVMGANQVIGSDHQGKIHPIMDELRAKDPLKPNLERLRGMTAKQMFDEMYPKIQRDFSVVRHVMIGTPLPSAIVTQNPELEELLKPQPFPEQQEVPPSTETMVAPQDVVEPLGGFDTSAPPEVTGQLPPITDDPSGEFAQPQVMTSQQDSNLEQLQEFGTQALNVAQQLPTAQIYRKVGGIYFRRVLVPTVKAAASTASTLYGLSKALSGSEF
jgi:hypothetical protein